MLTKPCAQSLRKSLAFWPYLSSLKTFMILPQHHVLFHRCHLEKKSKVRFTFILSLQQEEKFGILFKGRLISILSKRFHTSFRYVVHLPTGESLTAFAICRQLTQLFSVENLFTALSSCCDIIKQLASFIGIKFTKQEWVSQWVSESVSDKGEQWSNSGPIKNNGYDFLLDIQYRFNPN